MTSLDPHTLAAEFLSAYQNGTSTTVPPSKREGAFDLDAAYATEAEFRRLREGGGRRPVGLKVGFANKAMWRVLKIDTLLWAHMYDDTVHMSAGGQAELAVAQWGSLKIEPEMVVRLKAPLEAAGLDAAAVLRAVEWVAIGFEVIGCPYPGWEFKAVDFVAGFGLHRALVVGEAMAVEEAAIPTLVEELGRFQLRLSKDGEFVEEGSGRNSLRSPALCVAELAGALLARPGAKALAAGDLISTGTLTTAQAIGAGEVWRVDVEGLLGASLSLRLA